MLLALLVDLFGSSCHRSLILLIILQSISKYLFCFFNLQGMTVAAFKRCVEERLGVSSDNQRLICCGKPLIDDTILQDSTIQNGSTVFLVLRLRGAPT